MKKIVVIMSFITVSIVGSLVSGHQGKNHDKPTALRAPKGGIIKALDEARVEVVSKGTNLKIYVYDVNLKPAATSRFKITATVKLPRTKKEEEIKLISKDNFFESSYDGKSIHRYTLKISVTDSKNSRTVNLTYTIEPRK